MTTQVARRNPDHARHRLWGLLWASVAAGLLGIGHASAEEIRIGGNGGSLATMQLLGEAYAKAHPGTRIVVLPSLGSSGGVKAVLSGAIQVGASARPLKDEEARAGGVALEYGRTPFVFATAASNKSTGVTIGELVDIYSGKIDRWPDGTRIRLVLRPIGDSDSDMIKSLSPAMRDALTEAEKRKGMAFAVTDQEAADRLEKIPGALGPSTLAQILTEKRSLKALKLGEIEPTAKTLADGRYPYHKRLFVVTAVNSPPSARQFAAFVQSAPAREILARTGHWVK